MNTEDYGPFAEVITIAAALAATFSLLGLKAFGRMKQWSWLVDDSPPFLVTAGARALAVVSIALTFVLISGTNYRLFGGLAFIVAALAAWLIVRFDRLRKVHIYRVPLLNENGTQVRDDDGGLLHSNLVIGTEKTMRADAKKALAKARENHGAVSLTDFLGGYGGSRTNNPEACWSREELASISSNLTMALMGIVLTTVLALYLAASVVHVYQGITPNSPAAHLFRIPDPIDLTAYK